MQVVSSLCVYWRFANRRSLWVFGHGMKHLCLTVYDNSLSQSPIQAFGTHEKQLSVTRLFIFIFIPFIILLWPLGFEALADNPRSTWQCLSLPRLFDCVFWAPNNCCFVCSQFPDSPRLIPSLPVRSSRHRRLFAFQRCSVSMLSLWTKFCLWPWRIGALCTLFMLLTHRLGCLWLAGRSLGWPRGTLNILLERERNHHSSKFLHADAQNDAGITLQ